MTAQVPIYNLRSGTASKRPAASGLAFGQIAINYNHSDPAIYLRGSSDDLVKVAPVFVGSGAPNATPASGGASGNTVGEQWLDITGGDYVTKVWDGTAWRSPVITSALIKNGTIVDEDINASAGIAVTKLGNGALPTGITITSDNIVNGTIVNADINAAAAIALSKLDTGALPSGITVNSNNIVDGSIVNADINASAAIGLSKLATGALPTGITINSDNIVDGSIVNADINASASIADTKLATIATAGKVSGSAITSGTITGSTAINTSGSIATTSTVAVGQSSVATFVELDLNGAFAQTVTTVAALDVDCSLGNYFIKTINANSTFTFSNVPSSRAYSFALELTLTSGAITWPAAVKWNSDTAPTLTTGKTHLLIFVTDDGGTRWRGAALVDYVN
jgi:hypothetical protein